MPIALPRLLPLAPLLAGLAFAACSDDDGPDVAGLCPQAACFPNLVARFPAGLEEAEYDLAVVSDGPGAFDASCSFMVRDVGAADTMCADDLCFSVAPSTQVDANCPLDFIIGQDGRVDGFSFRPSSEGIMPTEADPDPARVALRETKTLTVRLTSAEAVLVDGSFSVVHDTYYPAGPRCGECTTGTVTLSSL